MDDQTKTDDQKATDEHTEKVAQIDSKIDDLKAKAETASPEEKTGIMAEIDKLKTEKDEVTKLMGTFAQGKQQVEDLAGKAKDVLGDLHL